MDPKKESRGAANAGAASSGSQSNRVIMQPTVPAHMQPPSHAEPGTSSSAAAVQGAEESMAGSSRGGPLGASSKAVADGGIGSGAQGGPDPLAASAVAGSSGSSSIRHPLELQPVDVTKEDHPLCLDHSSALRAGE